MDELRTVCEQEGMQLERLEIDRGVLVLSVSEIPDVEVLDRVSDALRELGYRFVAVEPS